MKIDAEGFDLNVLIGAKENIVAENINVLQFEYGYSPNNHFLKDYFDLLAPYFEFYRILPTGLRKVNSYSLELEIPFGFNYPCIKKQ